MSSNGWMNDERPVPRSDSKQIRGSEQDCGAFGMCFLRSEPKPSSAGSIPDRQRVGAPGCDQLDPYSLERGLKLQEGGLSLSQSGWRRSLP